MGTPRIFLDDMTDTVYIMYGAKGKVVSIDKYGEVGERSTLPPGVTDLNSEGTWQEGFDIGRDEGYETGYDRGYDDGYEAGIEVGEGGW